MSRRTTFIDRTPGEMRGVVRLDDRPERLIILRDDDNPRERLGAQMVARVESLEPALSTAFLDLGEGVTAILPYKPENKPIRGTALAVEIRTEGRRGKSPIVRVLGPAEGEPRLLEAPPSLEQLLGAFARDTAPVEGRDAREAADEAEAEVLEPVHNLPGGGCLAVEPTRALTAIDVDLSSRKGADAKRVTRQANIEALHQAARLLRLKGLGGLVVIDLVGRGHDGAALMSAARAAFAPDNPGVAIGPVGRFGTMEMSLPRRLRPRLEILTREDGSLSDRAVAQRLVRRLEDEAIAQPGARLTARAHPDVIRLAEPLVAQLAARRGKRFLLSAEAQRASAAFDVGSE